MINVDKKTGEITINGWENGIADNLYDGISDCRNMNIVSVPKEASVNFSTALNSFASIPSGVVASANAGADTVSYVGTTGTPVSGMAVVFAGGSLPGGITAGTQASASDTNVYWISNVDTGAQTFKVYTNPGLSSLVDITSNGTGTFSTIDVNQTRFGAFDGSNYWAIDKVGRVWTSGVSFSNWTFTGNITRANANGNGLVYYQASNGNGYIFAFRNSRIDYTRSNTISWVYGWNPATGGSGNDSLATASGTANSHHSLVGQDNVVYICDANFISAFFEKTGQAFDPTNTATYTNEIGTSLYALKLPYIETAQYLAELGINLMIAGSRFLVYPWDRTSTSFKFPIFLADNFMYTDMSGSQPNLPKMVTINTNTYIFMGNRGRIYITNGTQAQLFKKVPDHISGTIEPYYTWGGVGFNKNQLYFGILATTNAGSTDAFYGGLWAVNMDSKALRLVNQLSYGSYTGYCTMFLPITNLNSAGSGFYAGWDNGSSVYGIDNTSSTPYTNYQSYIDTDLVPIGTVLTPYTASNIEWKLTKPMVSGEGVRVLYRTDFSQAFTLIWENTTAGVFSDEHVVNFQNAQWVQFEVQTKSTASSPSYTRLTELRIRK